MIKLNQDNLIKIGSDYAKKINPIIKQKYYSVQNRNSKSPNIGLNFYNMISIKNKLNKKLVNDILTKPFPYLFSKYPDVNNYFLTSKCIFHSSFQIDKELELCGEKRNKNNRSHFRETFVSQYRNPWIDQILTSHWDYSSSSSKFEAFIIDLKLEMDFIQNQIEELFNYDDDMAPNVRREILTAIGIEVCPYCNRQYISSYADGTIKKTTADLDHFYPKSKFNLFSFSLYNFIPSCQICNSRFKGAKPVELLYPYEHGFQDDAYFIVKLNSASTIDSLTGNNTIFDLNIEYEQKLANAKCIKSGIELFQLNNLYQNHKESVRELLYKKYVYSKTHKAQLEDLFKEMNLSSNDINLFLYGNNLNPNEFWRRPLSKLSYDIILRS